MDILLNIPVCLQGQNGRYLQNAFGTGEGRSQGQNTDAWEQLIFLATESGKLIIQSRWNGKNLRAQTNGRCVFASYNSDVWEQFDIFYQENKFCFRSCYTQKYMRCSDSGEVICDTEFENLGECHLWNLIYPMNTFIMTTRSLKTIGLGITGVACAPIVGLSSASLVPVAMSTFGTVVPGVGTFHAPLAAGGVAAALQATSATLLTANSAAIGGAVGTAVGMICPGSYSNRNTSPVVHSVPPLELNNNLRSIDSKSLSYGKGGISRL